MKVESNSTAAKLITCVLPDSGADKVLLKALRFEKQVVRAKSVAGKGVGALRSVKSKKDTLPESNLVKIVEVVVDENEADELFDYIYETAGIGQQGGGAIFMSALPRATLYTLPPDIADEKTRLKNTSR